MQKKKKLFCKGNVWLKLILNKIIKNRLKGFLSNTPVKQKKNFSKKQQTKQGIKPFNLFFTRPDRVDPKIFVRQ
jgi:hypothetical protein